MKNISKSTIVLISGPACVGKGPLMAGIKAFYSDLKFSEVQVIKSKESRPKGPRSNEIKNWCNPRYFRNASNIMKLKKDPRFLIGDCRGFPQAIDTKEFYKTQDKLFIIEAYHTLGAQFRSLDNILDNFNIINVFISPLSIKELKNFKKQNYDLKSKITEIMLEKLEKRSIFQNKDPNDIKVKKDNIERAEDAYNELQSARNYSIVLVNHNAEGHPNWKQTSDGKFNEKPIGEAWNLIEAFHEILTTGNSKHSEKWNIK